VVTVRRFREDLMRASRITALAAGAFVAAGAAVFPTAAQAATTGYAVDCDDANTGYGYAFVLPDDTVTLTLSRCDAAQTLSGSFDAAAWSAGSTAVLRAGDVVQFSDTGGARATVSVQEAPPADIPAGELLLTEQISLGPDSGEIVVADNTGTSVHRLADDEGCAVFARGAESSHVYGTLDVTVTTSGVYTFRGIGSDPAGSRAVLFGDYDPIQDPFLAVYDAFDPTSPDDGVIGCNDDQSDLGDRDTAQFLSDGTLVDGRQPMFQAALEPGTYTLVLLTYVSLTAEELAAGSGVDAGTFAPGEKSVTFQLWGPAGGLIVAPASEAAPQPSSAGTVAAAAPAAPAPELAATGAGAESATVGWAGIALVLAGLVLSFVRRRILPRR